MGLEHNFFVGDFILVRIVFLLLVVFREQFHAALIGSVRNSRFVLRLMIVFLQFGHGKTASSFLTDSGKKSR